MKQKVLIVGWIFILAISLSACGDSPTAAPATDDNKSDRLSTAVAGTLTAAAPVPTGTATPAPTATPTVEPTRQPGPLRVVYSRAGSIWVWTEGGTPKQLTNNIVDAKPRLSDDGKWIVFERNNELYQVRPDGSDLKVLVSDAFLKPYLPTGYKFIWAEYYDWMPNSHFVYFTTKTGISGYYTDIFQYDLFRADVDSGEVKQLIAPGSGGVPYFSVDNKTIAMMQAQAIYLSGFDGMNARKALSFDYEYTGSDWYKIPVAVPLPDASGFRVLLSYHGTIDNPLKPPEQWNITTEGNATLLYTLPDSSNSLYYTIGYRYLAPDGEEFAYVHYEHDKNSQICFHINGITQDDCWFQQGINGGFFGWAPDSIHFLTSEFDENNESHMFINDGNGNAIKIQASGLIYWIDTQRYVYIDQDSNLYVASVDGESLKIDKGIKGINGKVDMWTWQFDFSY